MDSLDHNKGVPQTSSDRLIPPWVPCEVVDSVDAREFAVAQPEVDRERRCLERELECYVAAYAREAESTPHGLCSVYHEADLSVAQLSLIRQAESRHPGVSFVAYAKPLRLRSQKGSHRKA